MYFFFCFLSICLNWCLVAPQRPRLEHEGELGFVIIYFEQKIINWLATFFAGVHVPPGHNITVDSGAMATVKCVSHYGNPPASLKWFLGKRLCICFMLCPILYVEYVSVYIVETEKVN
jgi:hypothetical protein